MSPINYFYPPDKKTVGLRGELLDQAGRPLGRLEVLVSYDYLIKDILEEGWMQAQMACLVSDAGEYLAHSNPAMKSRLCLGETHNPLELAMLKALKEKPYATLLGQGYTPAHVIGYYKLHAAPWAIMLHAQGSQILAPILRFRFYYLAGGLLCLAVILVLIRLSVRPVVLAIHEIAARADLVAHGQYGEPLPVASRDEIGRLTASFNDMVAGLKERDFISNTFGRYVDQEIARELLSRPEAMRLGGGEAGGGHPLRRYPRLHPPGGKPEPRSHHPPGKPPLRQDDRGDPGPSGDHRGFSGRRDSGFFRPPGRPPGPGGAPGP
jgi:HAMP domain-containing protein